LSNFDAPGKYRPETGFRSFIMPSFVLVNSTAVSRALFTPEIHFNSVFLRVLIFISTNLTTLYV
jgi:hypothetical protein